MTKDEEIKKLKAQVRELKQRAKEYEEWWDQEREKVRMCRNWLNEFFDDTAQTLSENKYWNMVGLLKRVRNILVRLG